LRDTLTWNNVCSFSKRVSTIACVSHSLSIRLRQAAADLTAASAVNVLRAGDLELDLVRRRVARLGKSIDLRPKEFLLLEYLVRNANRPVTRTMILEHVWNSSFEGLTNVVDVYISALRNKVDRGFPLKLIQTNRGIGYTFVAGDALPAASNGHGVRPPQFIGDPLGGQLRRV
jgi:DNA-binding response OmpR family regulator